MYLWFVFAHLVGLVLFLVPHGVSMYAVFRVRELRDRAGIAALLELSAQGSQSSYLGLIVLVIGGLAAAYTNSQLTAGWIVASYVVLTVVLGAMYGIAAPYYYGLRAAIGIAPVRSRGTQAEAAVPIDDAELFQRLDTRRPEALMAVGGLGLLALVWLMVLKPF